MPKQSRNDESIKSAEDVIGQLPGQAVAVIIAGIVAAWISAGSSGFLGHSLRHVLTAFFLGVAVLAAWPWPVRTLKNFMILATGVLAALLLNSTVVPTINVLGVVLLLATLAYLHDGLVGRAILLAAMAAMTLAVFRLAVISVPVVWHLADVLGWSMGKLVGGLTGRSLTIGATFGGIDFLVLMIALYVGWIFSIAHPRGRAGMYGLTAIVFAHFAYLVTLAYWEYIAATLPTAFYIPETDISRVGGWAWQNAVRGFLPWNLPLLAVILQAIVATCMFRWADWLPVANRNVSNNYDSKQYQAEIVSFSTLSKEVALKFGPILLAALIPLLTSLAFSNADLKGKTVAAYSKGNFNWQKPEYGVSIESGYGMLPIFVESIGGRFVKLDVLSQEELSKADVLVLLHPNTQFTSEQLQNIEKYVREGGSLLVGAENFVREGGSESRFNDVLKPTGMEVRNDTTIPLSPNWEQSYEALSHPATVGMDDLRNRFGFQRGASIRLGWFGSPIVVGKWGWTTPGSDAVKLKAVTYLDGQPLGDIVLAAEEPLGKGRVVVLGDMACLNNERLSCSYEFAGRLLGYLANRTASPQAVWRQVLAILGMIILIGLLAKNCDPTQTAVTSFIFAGALVAYTWHGTSGSLVLPDGRFKMPNKLAYIDASHLEAYSSDLWSDFGIAGFTRTLMRNGFLPLRMPELTNERLERAGLFVSMAPARSFTTEELAAVRKFVESGGTFVCMVGAEEVRPSMAMLEEFQFKIAPSPILPGENIREPDPLGAFAVSYGRPNNEKIEVQFYAAWPMELLSDSFVYIRETKDEKEYPVVASARVGQGRVLVIADTYFAANLHLESAVNEFPSHINFWRELLSTGTEVDEPSPPEKPRKELDLLDKGDLMPDQGPE